MFYILSLNNLYEEFFFFFYINNKKIIYLDELLFDGGDRNFSSLIDLQAFLFFLTRIDGKLTLLILLDQTEFINFINRTMLMRKKKK